MADRDPVSVLLPTTEWNTACADLAAQLGPADELLVICDTAADPVAGHDPPAGVRICLAGEPAGCSGKANALAHGMALAQHDRLVWTDDDFDRDADWLDQLVAAGDQHGPATAIPFFTGDGWWRLFEPWYGALFVALVYFQVGSAANVAWGGGVTFTRAELTVSVPTLTDELRTVLSDDYLLTQRLPSVHPVRSLVMPVVVPGDARSVRHRLHRFTRLVGVNAGWRRGLVLTGVLAAGAVAVPLVVAPLVTVGFAALYAWFGFGRVTFLTAYLGLLAVPLVVTASLVGTEFEWGGRRYRLAASGAVTVRAAATEDAGPD
jgi:hypothetical protein